MLQVTSQLDAARNSEVTTDVKNLIMKSVQKHLTMKTKSGLLNPDLGLTIFEL